MRTVGAKCSRYLNRIRHKYSNTNENQFDGHESTKQRIMCESVESLTESPRAAMMPKSEGVKFIISSERSAE